MKYYQPQGRRVKQWWQAAKTQTEELVQPGGTDCRAVSTPHAQSAKSPGRCVAAEILGCERIAAAEVKKRVPKSLATKRAGNVTRSDGKHAEEFNLLLSYTAAQAKRAVKQDCNP